MKSRTVIAALAATLAMGLPALASTMTFVTGTIYASPQLDAIDNTNRFGLGYGASLVGVPAGDELTRRPISESPVGVNEQPHFAVQHIV